MRLYNVKYHVALQPRKYIGDIISTSSISFSMNDLREHKLKYWEGDVNWISTIVGGDISKKQALRGYAYLQFARQLKM